MTLTELAEKMRDLSPGQYVSLSLEAEAYSTGKVQTTITLFARKKLISVGSIDEALRILSATEDAGQQELPQ